MKAIILAGGFGTRLYPLTKYRPKHMLPIIDKPLIHCIVDYVLENGFDEIVISIGQEKDFGIIKRYFKNIGFDKKISFIQEPKRLGGVGAIKYALNKMKINETFALILGDNLTKINLKEMIKIHEEKDAIATLALVETKTPWLYGIAKIDGNDIIDFIEKPKNGNKKDKWASTGVYVMSPKIVDYMPDDFLDSTGMIFPLILKKGGKIIGFKSKDLWVDVGNKESYLRANKEVLMKSWNSEGRPMIWVHDCKNLNPYAEYSGDFVLIHKGCRIEDNVKIKNSIILPDVTIHNGACIDNSIIDEGAVIGKNSNIKDCIISAHSKIKNYSNISENFENGSEKDGNS